MANAATFSHRPNKDGTVDSICPYCFMTVASHAPELALQPLEDEHQCFGDFATRRKDLEERRASQASREMVVTG